MRLTALSIGLFSSSLALASASQPAAPPLQLVNDSTYDLGAITISTTSAVKKLGVNNILGVTKTSSDSSEDQIEKPEEVLVTVKKGESLSKIAKAHDTTFKRLYNANESIKHPDLINPGHKIRIPNKDEELKSRALPEPPKKKIFTTKVVTKPRKKSNYTPAPRQTVVSRAPAVANGSVWDRLAQCESGGNWSISTGNGYYGGLQFTLSTWQSVGGSGYPHQNSREEQIKRGQILQARSGWGQWPACTLKLGLR